MRHQPSNVEPHTFRGAMRPRFLPNHLMLIWPELRQQVTAMSACRPMLADPCPLLCIGQRRIGQATNSTWCSRFDCDPSGDKWLPTNTESTTRDSRLACVPITTSLDGLPRLPERHLQVDLRDTVTHLFGDNWFSALATTRIPDHEVDFCFEPFRGGPADLVCLAVSTR